MLTPAFTPVTLHRGWIVGLGKTITAVSGSYTMLSSAGSGSGGGQPPIVRVFGLFGTEEAPVHPPTIHRAAGSSWVVVLELRDWAQVGVITAA